MISLRMATFPARRNRLRDALLRLAPQVDEIRLCLNEYESIPREILSIDKVHAVIPQEDKKDVGKFIFDAQPGDEIFLADDDIDYPENYVSQTRKKAARTGLVDDAVFGYHGTVYRRFHPKRRFINAVLGRGFGPYPPGSLKDLYPFHEKLTHPRIVSQLGTGTVYCLGRNLPGLDIMRGSQQRVDVRMALWSAQTGRPMIALPRDGDWMPSTGEDKTSIYHNFTQHFPEDLKAEIALFGFTVPRAGQRL